MKFAVVVAIGLAALAALAVAEPAAYGVCFDDGDEYISDRWSTDEDDYCYDAGQHPLTLPNVDCDSRRKGSSTDNPRLKDRDGPEPVLSSLYEALASIGKSDAEIDALLAGNAEREARRGDKDMCWFRGLVYEPSVSDSVMCPHLSGKLNCNQLPDGDLLDDIFADTYCSDSVDPLGLPGAPECAIAIVAFAYCSEMDLEAAQHIDVREYTNSGNSVTVHLHVICDSFQDTRHEMCYANLNPAGRPFDDLPKDAREADKLTRSAPVDITCSNSCDCSYQRSCFIDEVRGDGMCLISCGRDGSPCADGRTCNTFHTFEHELDDVCHRCNFAGHLEPQPLDVGETSVGYVRGETCCSDGRDSFYDFTLERSAACPMSDDCRAFERLMLANVCDNAPDNLLGSNLDYGYPTSLKLCESWVEEAYAACTNQLVCPPGFDCSSIGLFCVPFNFLPGFESLEAFKFSIPALWVGHKIVSDDDGPCYGVSFDRINGRGLLLDISGSCPGDINVQLVGAQPNSNLALVIGPRRAHFVESAAGCNDLDLNVEPRRVLTQTSDENGWMTLTVPVELENVCDLWVQVVDIGTCQVSEAHGLWV